MPKSLRTLARTIGVEGQLRDVRFIRGNLPAGKEERKSGKKTPKAHIKKKTAQAMNP